ncbi:undecaprenyl-phosphate mannosyltransferase [mine drainage metagenome]|uniref:Undecaprenyl-phosphate mannosyltransferase n=1 Tax=mine drainage metagenome TaxID=410659 RepID=A0A1J5RAP8_9ZZZZ
MRVLVVIPTYNELGSLPLTLDRLRTAVPTAEVLIVDDGSPDGTGELADERAAADSSVHVMHRTEKRGLGPAYLAGFAWALERGYDVIVEMDADGSHRAVDLPGILARIDADPSRPADLVLGSRWIPGGHVQNWPWHRQLLSRGGNTYARILLGIPLKDVTGGFRAYRASALAAMDLAGIESHGYCFQVDMARRLIRSGANVVEVPITFVEREAGESKMSRGIVVEALAKVTQWGLQDVTHAAAGAVRRLLRG